MRRERTNLGAFWRRSPHEGPITPGCGSPDNVIEKLLLRAGPLSSSPRRGARHEHTAVRAGARRATRAQLGLRRRVAECIPLRLRAGTCVGRGAVEVGVGCGLSHRPASRAALPPGTRARCPLAPRGGEPPLGRRRRRAHAAGRPGGASPTFAPHLSTGGAHRARASGTPPTPPTAGVRPPPRRRRPRRAPRDAPPPRRARTPRCTPAPTHMHTHMHV